MGLFKHMKEAMGGHGDRRDDDADGRRPQRRHRAGPRVQAPDAGRPRRQRRHHVRDRLGRARRRQHRRRASSCRSRRRAARPTPSRSATSSPAPTSARTRPAPPTPCGSTRRTARTSPSAERRGRPQRHGTRACASAARAALAPGRRGRRRPDGPRRRRGRARGPASRRGRGRGRAEDELLVQLRRAAAERAADEVGVGRLEVARPGDVAAAARGRGSPGASSSSRGSIRSANALELAAASQRPVSPSRPASPRTALRARACTPTPSPCPPAGGSGRRARTGPTIRNGRAGTQPERQVRRPARVSSSRPLGRRAPCRPRARPAPPRGSGRRAPSRP